MNIQLRYFASIREAMGMTGEAVAMPDGADVATIRDALIARGGAHASTLARGRALRCAVNHVLCEETVVVTEGSELAFFPPVTGG